MSDGGIVRPSASGMLGGAKGGRLGGLGGFLTKDDKIPLRHNEIPTCK